MYLNCYRTCRCSKTTYKVFSKFPKDQVFNDVFVPKEMEIGDENMYTCIILLNSHTIHKIKRTNLINGLYFHSQLAFFSIY